MNRLFFVAVAAGLVACGADLQVPGGPNRNNNNANNNGTPSCDGLDGDTFNTEQDQPIDQRCQFDTQGNYQCTDLYGTWSIVFDQGDFYWDTYQTVGVGTYTCRNGLIEGDLNGQDYQGTFSGGVLVWDGLRYRR